MDDTLLQYYERELTFIREMGAEFAKKYPKIAGRLLLEADKCEDPHTERLIEAFALLCGRIHHKIDDDFPEITESLFNIIYPHYISPIPSMTVVKFEPVRQTITPAGYRIEKGHPALFQACGRNGMPVLHGIPCHHLAPGGRRCRAQGPQEAQGRCAACRVDTAQDLQQPGSFAAGLREPALLPERITPAHVPAL